MDALDDLFFHAKVEQNNSHRTKRAIGSKREFDTSYRASFRAENWQLCAQVQLVHAHENIRTLVGLFDELVHCSVPGCRRLTATTQRNPALGLKMEEVMGAAWLPEVAWKLRQQATERKLELVADLQLDLGQHLHAEAVLCTAWLVGGGLQRLCVTQETRFEGNVPRTILCVPEGLDVLEGLTHECKAALWEQVQEEVEDA